MNPVSVQFLGSGDAFGSGGRLQTCIYVECAATRFLLDCGASSLIAMKRWTIHPNCIKAILLSHLHGDHFGGLPFFMLDAQLVSKRTEPLIIAGPPGTATRMREALEVFFPGSSQVKQRFPVAHLEWVEGKQTPVAELRVTPYEVIHASGAPAYALRVECGERVIAYSGDTEWTDALLAVAQGVDLFICEAYYLDKQMKYHLNYRTLMAYRAKLACKRLILTHMNDDLLGRLEQVDAEYAEDGKRIFL